MSTFSLPRLIVRAATAAAVTASLVTAGGTAAHAATDPPVLTLSTDTRTLLDNDWAYLTLTASKNTDLDKYLLIYDTTAHYLVSYCGPQTSYCSANVSYNDGQTHTFIGYSAPYDYNEPPANFDSMSNPEAVTWVDPRVTLQVVPPRQTVGGQVQLEAASNDPRSGTFIQIWDADTHVKLVSCLADQCEAPATKATAGTRNFLAVMSYWDDPNYEPWWWLAQSDTATGTWVDPLPPSSSIASSACDSGLQVIDSTNEGVRTKVYTRQPSSQETDVCVRVSNGTNGVGFGGEFVITPTLPGVNNIPGPPTRDSNSSACSTTTPNGVPGSHPASSGGIAGVTYLVDTYSSANAAWVCLSVGSTNVRVIVPISVPSPFVPPPGAQVNFVPDPGTPDIL